MTSAPTVAYVAGSGRSGSTLIDRLLGGHEGCVSVGEVRLLWQEGLLENRSCGCGAPFRECPFWSEVGVAAFGGWDNVDAREVLDMARAASRNRFFPWLLAPGLPPRWWHRRVSRYLEILEPLYLAIARVSGARVLIDSSKDPAYGMVLARSRRIDLRIIHLVRDSRGVAFSWNKHFEKDPRTQRPPLRTYHPLATAFRWLTFNSLVQMMSRRRVAALRISYEQFLASSRETLDRLLAFLGVDASQTDSPFISEGEVELRVSHTVSGHPTRMQQGPAHLKLDDEWVGSMRRPHRIAVTAITSPWLLAYGYSLRVPKKDRSEESMTA